MNFPKTHYLSAAADGGQQCRRHPRPRAHRLLGHGERLYRQRRARHRRQQHPDQARHQADQHQLGRAASPRRTTRTSSASSRSTCPMAADAEATLPALIEAVKSAIPNDRKAAIEKRGEAAKKAFAEARERTKQAAALAWDASPISTARLVMETCGADQGPRLVARCLLRQRQQLAEPAVADGEALPLARRIGRLRRRLRRAGVGRRRARQPRPRPLLGQHPVRRRPDVRAGRAVDRGEAQDPAARGDAQQPRLSSGGHARAAAVELPQPRGKPRQRHGPDRHQHRESRHRVPQARGIDGLVGEGADQGSGPSSGRRSRRRSRW